VDVVSWRVASQAVSGGGVTGGARRVTLETGDAADEEAGVGA